MNRREFGKLAGAFGAMAASPAPARRPAESFVLSRNGWMPNNEYLPVLLYRGVFPKTAETVKAMEEVFGKNLWPAQWRNGVYSFHHYHSTAHEVLGFAAGAGTLMLGGEGGRRVTVGAGDVLVLPTGTGHCRLEADEDFLVVGAYPQDQHWDICRAAPDEATAARMLHLPFPNSDPLAGVTGQLTEAWRRR